MKLPRLVLNSPFQVILLPLSPKVLGLQAWATVPSLVFIIVSVFSSLVQWWLFLLYQYALIDLNIFNVSICSIYCYYRCITSHIFSQWKPFWPVETFSGPFVTTIAVFDSFFNLWVRCTKLTHHVYLSISPRSPDSFYFIFKLLLLLFWLMLF